MNSKKGQKVWGVFLIVMGSIFLGALVWIAIPQKIPGDQKWVFYDRNDEILFSEKAFFTAENSDFQKIAQMLVEREDQNFWKHSGIDIGAIIRATFQNLKSQHTVSGASTLTMQLARMSFLENEPHDFWYKFRQIVYALKLEFQYSKSEILKTYMDRVYLGQGANGFSAAAHRYFSKSVSALSTDEMAMLIGIIPRPDSWNPITDPEMAESRKKEVLNVLFERGVLSKEERDFFASQKIKINPSFTNDIAAPHFVLWAKNKLHAFVSPDVSLVQVHTTVDKQKYAQALNIVRQNLEKKKDNNISNGAVVAISFPKNQLEVLLGGTDFFQNTDGGKINMATAKRELGSTLKPFLFALALEKGFSPATEIRDERQSFSTEKGTYSPRNFDPGTEYGRVRFREALVNSYNISAVSLLNQIGVFPFRDFLKKFGLQILDGQGESGLSLILGSGEESLLSLSHAYTVFFQQGKFIPVQFFTSITDENGKTILRWEDFPEARERSQIIKPENAEWITNALSDQAMRWHIFKRGNPLEMEFETASKTGTSQDFRDNYAVGFSSQHLVGVWVGNADGTPMNTSSGVEGAGPIWQGMMRLLHASTPPKFSYFSERKKVRMCRNPLENMPECSEQFDEFLLPSDFVSPPQKRNESLSRLQISFPGEGDIFHPDSSLLIQVRNAKLNADILYFLDGKKVEKIIPHLDQGQHILRVESEGESDEITITVDGNR